MLHFISTLVLALFFTGCAVVYKKPQLDELTFSKFNQSKTNSIYVTPLLKYVKVDTNGCVDVYIEQNDSFDELIITTLQSMNIKADIQKLDRAKVYIQCDEDISNYLPANADMNSYIIYQYQEYKASIRPDNFAGLGLALVNAVWAFSNVLTIGMIPYYDSAPITYRIHKLGNVDKFVSQVSSNTFWVWGPLIFSKNSTIETPPFFSKPTLKSNSEAIKKLVNKVL